MVRWTEHKPGEIRRQGGFLWFPRQIGLECRWLEYAEWAQEYSGKGDDWGDTGSWIDRRWL